MSRLYKACSISYNQTIIIRKTYQLKKKPNHHHHHQKTQTAEKPLDITNCMMHERLFTDYLIQTRLSQHKRIIRLKNPLWYGKHQPPLTVLME